LPTFLAVQPRAKMKATQTTPERHLNTSFMSVL
jgi:hypothetical protein